MTTSATNTASTSGNPSDAARTKLFKLALSIPGKNIGGEWLCRATGAALAYQNYCDTAGTPRIFTWYTHTDGLDYLQDQEGNWLSWETTAQCLYMSYWHNAAAWKLDGERLIRVKDGAVVSRPEKQSWPLANQHFLMALGPNEWALTVRLVEEPMPPVNKLLEDLTPVVAKRHQPGDGVDRYLYTTRTSAALEDLATKQAYLGRTASFFGVRKAVAGEATVPVYLLESATAVSGAPSYKLSLKKEEAGYRLMADNADGQPNFLAFASDQAKDYLPQVYEHAAPIPGSTQQRYVYDFVADAHDGWGRGEPAFRAVSVTDAHQALAGSTGAQSARRYAADWVDEHGHDLVELFGKLGKNDVNGAIVSQYEKKTSGLPPIRYVSIGAGGHLGYGLGTVGVELGAIWPLAKFGHVPALEPLSDYSVEWVTFGGATGVDIGASADVCAVGVWYGDLEQINGACNGVTVSLQYFAGISVNLLWDGTWQGANESAHPIGVTVVMAAGVEAGMGVFYNASATQFWNRRPDFPPI